MPIYEYYCQECDNLHEQMQKMSEEPLKVCPKCQKESLIKQVSSTSFQLKGTGWYVTDFRDKGKPKIENTKAKSETASDTETSPSKEKETASKPAEKNETKQQTNSSKDQAA